jgi:Domain of Unknown Function (DUF1521)
MIGWDAVSQANLQDVQNGRHAMNNISGQNFFAPQQNGRCGCNRASIVDGAAFVMAAGIMGQFFNRLGSGPFAFPQLPSLFNIGCGTPPSCGFPPCGPCVIPEPKNTWTASMTGGNTAKVDLGDGYKLEIDERSSQITIINEKTGERTRIWGDPHVEVDGKHAYDFWGTTTFTLENGTKITINTEQWGGNPNAYVASQVVVTKGSNALVIDGVSQNKLGDLSMTLSNDGRAIDAAHRDGFVLNENECGSGWMTSSGTLATQKDLDATRVGREFGPGSEVRNLDELGGVFSQFLLFGNFINFASNLGSAFSDATPKPSQRQPVQPVRTPVLA